MFTGKRAKEHRLSRTKIMIQVSENGEIVDMMEVKSEGDNILLCHQGFSFPVRKEIATQVAEAILYLVGRDK